MTSFPAYSPPNCMKNYGTDDLMRSIFYVRLSLALARRKATPFCAAETASLPILILTARGESSERVKGLELGADDNLVKPFSMRELICAFRPRRGVRARAHTRKLVLFGVDKSKFETSAAQTS